MNLPLLSLNLLCHDRGGFAVVAAVVGVVVAGLSAVAAMVVLEEVEAAAARHKSAIFVSWSKLGLIIVIVSRNRNF